MMYFILIFLFLSGCKPIGSTVAPDEADESSSKPLEDQVILKSERVMEVSSQEFSEDNSEKTKKNLSGKAPLKAIKSEEYFLNHLEKILFFLKSEQEFFQENLNQDSWVSFSVSKIKDHLKVNTPIYLNPVSSNQSSLSYLVFDLSHFDEEPKNESKIPKIKEIKYTFESKDSALTGGEWREGLGETKIMAFDSTSSRFYCRLNQLLNQIEQDPCRQPFCFHEKHHNWLTFEIEFEDQSACSLIVELKIFGNLPNLPASYQFERIEPSKQILINFQKNPNSFLTFEIFEDPLSENYEFIFLKSKLRNPTNRPLFLQARLPSKEVKTEWIQKVETVERIYDGIEPNRCLISLHRKENKSHDTHLASGSIQAFFQLNELELQNFQEEDVINLPPASELNLIWKVILTAPDTLLKSTIDIQKHAKKEWASYPILDSEMLAINRDPPAAFSVSISYVSRETITLYDKEIETICKLIKVLGTIQWDGIKPQIAIAGSPKDFAQGYRKCLDVQEQN